MFSLLPAFHSPDMNSERSECTDVVFSTRDVRDTVSTVRPSQLWGICDLKQRHQLYIVSQGLYPLVTRFTTWTVLFISSGFRSLFHI